MSKLIVYTNEFGLIEFSTVFDGRTLNGIKKRIKDVLVFTSISDVCSEDPKAEFKDCWKIECGEVVVDLDLLKLRMVSVIRTVRNERLDDLDRAYMRAVEIGNIKEKKRIADIKSRLRDAPSDTIAALKKCNTLDDVRAYAPTVLEEA
jgi:hypothetical protein